jgi:hypothetical protein
LNSDIRRLLLFGLRLPLHFEISFVAVNSVVISFDGLDATEAFPSRVPWEKGLLAAVALLTDHVDEKLMNPAIAGKFRVEGCSQ